MKIARFDFFLLELPNFLASIVIAILSGTGTIVVWVDLASSLNSTIHQLLVFLIANKLRKGDFDRYNFGGERLDIFTSLTCDVLLLFCIILCVGGSILGLIYPQEASPLYAVILFLCLKVVNISADIYVTISNIKLSKSSKTAINKTELATSWFALITDVAVWVIGLLCLLFRDQDWMEYASPAACIAYCVYFFVTTVIRSRHSLGYLLDKAAPETDQNAILDLVLSGDRSLIEEIKEVKTRLVNDELRVDLDIRFKDDVSFAQETAYLDAIQKRVGSAYSGAQVQLVHLPKEEPVKKRNPKRKRINKYDLHK